VLNRKDGGGGIMIRKILTIFAICIFIITEVVASLNEYYSIQGLDYLLNILTCAVIVISIAWASSLYITFMVLAFSVDKKWK
jgi:hypothetical protein